MTTATVEYQKHCPASPSQMADWQGQLEQRVPRYKKGHETLSWLYLRWHAGDPWHPIGRFVVWQVWPRGIVPFGPDGGVPQELQGPSPRSEGHYCGGKGWCPETPDGAPICPTPKYRWAGGPCKVITKDQWEIYREVGSFATRYFVVQGTAGGHRVELSPAEVSLLGANGRPTEMPKMGDLAYAEPDDRTWDILAGYDQLWKWQRETDQSFEERTVEDQERWEREKAEAAAVKQLALIDAQIEGWASEHLSLLKRVAQAERGEWGDYRGVQGSMEEQDVPYQRFITQQKGRLY